jgi:membrane fusion protein, adhesin transport system
MTLEQRLFARTSALRMGREYRLGLILTGILFVLSAWASWAELDEQIRATGTAIVSSRSQVVQVVDGGVLQRLLVKEGDPVKRGDLLAELDTARFQASTEEVSAKLNHLKASMARLSAELDETPLRFPPELALHVDVTEAQRSLYERRRQLQREEQSALARSIRLAEQELKALEELAQTGDAAEAEVLRLRRQVNELRALAVNKRNTYRQEAQSELAKARTELEQSEQILAQRREALEATRISAPMGGTVKNVRVTTIGAVFRSGEELLQIVPSDEPLIIEAKVRPADVGFIRKDLKANVKLDAYDSAVYGSLKGHVTYISPDTLRDEQSRDEQPYYRVHVQIDEIPPRSRDRIEVLPGMTSTVEIITGRRTVAQYLLKPIRRASSEALVER